MTQHSTKFRSVRFQSVLSNMRMCAMKKSMVLCVLTVCMFGSSAAQAATVSWSSTPYTVNGNVGQNLDTGLFDTTGTQVLAENLGGSALAFDGINFSAPTHNFPGTFGGYHGAGNTTLAADGTFDVSAPLSAKTVTLTGLTSGNQYRIQALVADGRAPFATGFTVEFDGINQGVYGNGTFGVTWGNALLVTGTFTADAASQGFTTEVFTAGSVSNGAQLNALLLHDITPPTAPEPSTFVLFGLGLIGLASRRRRNRRSMNR